MTKKSIERCITTECSLNFRITTIYRTFCCQQPWNKVKKFATAIWLRF